MKSPEDNPIVKALKSPEFPEESIEAGSEVTETTGEDLAKLIKQFKGRRITITGGTKELRRRTMGDIQAALAKPLPNRITSVLSHDESSITFGIMIADVLP